jgi:hypothetical protein
MPRFDAGFVVRREAPAQPRELSAASSLAFHVRSVEREREQARAQQHEARRR